MNRLGGWYWLLPFIRRSPRCRPQISTILKLLQGDEELIDLARQQISSAENLDDMGGEDSPINIQGLEGHCVDTVSGRKWRRSETRIRGNRVPSPLSVGHGRCRINIERSERMQRRTRMYALLIFSCKAAFRYGRHIGLGRKLHRTEDRVRVLQERLRKIVDTEESAASSAVSVEKSLPSVLLLSRSPTQPSVTL